MSTSITIDGEPIDLPEAQEAEKTYVLLNKPSGVYCTNVAQGEQRRAIDLLPPEIDKRLYPVGRLDADSRGLLLLDQRRRPHAETHAPEVRRLERRTPPSSTGT